MTSSTRVSPISVRPAGKSIPITDMAASQSGQLVALTASVGSQPRWAQAPQLRQMRSKTIPVPAVIGARSPPRSTQVQRNSPSPACGAHPRSPLRDSPSPLAGEGRGGGSLLLLVDHVVQVRGRRLDVGVLALARPDLGRKHATPMDLLEVPIRKLVVPFGVDVRLRVDSEVPFAVLGIAVHFDEAILILG